MKQRSASAYHELKNVGFSAPQSGGVFNLVHRVYICERQNAETEVSGDRLKPGFIKNAKTFNT